MREIENLKKAILEEYPRLSEDSEFEFSCNKDVPCFNDCCGDVNIFLTPYDVLRLKNHLEISSGEFLRQYTISPFDENLKYPVVLLKMNDNEKKSCQFVTEDGCSVRLVWPRPAKTTRNLARSSISFLKNQFAKDLIANTNGQLANG